VEHGLDLPPFYDDYTEAPGAPPYDPRLMLKLLILATPTGSRRRGRWNDAAITMWRSCSSRPRRHRTWWRPAGSTKRHLQAFTALFTQALSLCAQAGLLSLGKVALDGSKIRASASRHRAMSYNRMVRAEGELAAEVEAQLADAECTDAVEDAAHGDRRGDELPAELARREGRLAAIGQAKTDQEAEHAAKAEQAAAKRGAGETEQAAAGEEAEAAAVVHRRRSSFTDPDARIMKTSDESLHYCYKAPTVVDEDSQII
jgi:hypothetical protein